MIVSVPCPDGGHPSTDQPSDRVSTAGAGAAATAVNPGATLAEVQAAAVRTPSVPITDPGGTHKLHLVFQTVPGGPAGGLGNLNGYELAGPSAGAP
ncbi:hypothetical protein SAMN05216276_100850 [Streptosporangium subroseum]|uniref:Uncharacterized protein n=1 Tax=Streptosporangium subroseum TaxID=106412 RepID=A0A239DSL8_9ACTN|nr:hypothetical protein [Streptosporangium subroseum]SNS35490.1 hypothetical protein SAMN05216276_100850 [Streptosporangium subroseum]